MVGRRDTHVPYLEVMTFIDNSEPYEILALLIHQLQKKNHVQQA